MLSGAGQRAGPQDEEDMLQEAPSGPGTEAPEEEAKPSMQRAKTLAGLESPPAGAAQSTAWQTPLTRRHRP